MISAISRSVTVAVAATVISSIALIGGAEAASTHKSKSYADKSRSHHHSRTYVRPSGDHGARGYKYQNFGTWDRDTSREGYYNIRRFDFDRGYY